MSLGCCPICCIAPPDLLGHLIEQGTEQQRDAAMKTLAASASMRARRDLISTLLRSDATHAAALAFIAPALTEKQTDYDAEHLGQASLPGNRVRGTGDPPAADPAINEAYDGAQATYDFYRDVLQRNSIDDQGMEIISSVHYGVAFDNAFWNGSQMVYGDGSGHIFVQGGLTHAIDVIGHELTHGVTQFTANLVYHGQSGALNESVSDVFGSLIKQKVNNQTADQADWLIGEGSLVPALGKALRSMKAPGTAFNGDTQPATMADYKDLPDDNDPRNDNGGVHTNSGIPNHAFYLAATAIGGNAWEKAGPIWYRALTQYLRATSDFEAAANATLQAADDLHPETSNAIEGAWKQVGVLT
jgi:Zn-dependent metalloprotease